MDVSPERNIELRSQYRSVRLALSRERVMTMAYAGVVLTCSADGQVHQRRWIPMGDAPSEADDEELIATLRRAQLWVDSGTRDESGPCC